MSLFVIADLHLSLGSDKPMDVFKGWNNYVERLRVNWDKVVGENDTVVIAGDISWAMKLEEAENDFRFIHERPGKKLILKGNHDYWWSTKTKMNNYLHSLGFDDIEFIHNSAYIVGDIAVCGTRGWMYNSESPEDKKIVMREVGRLKASIEEAIKAGAKPVVFLHYPPVYDIYVCHEILDTMKEYGINDCYYGHIHGAQAAKKAPFGEHEGVRMHLISCDYLGFVPMLVSR